MEALTPMSLMTRTAKLACVGVLAALATACGGGDAATGNSNVSTSRHAVGGELSGLSEGGSITLMNNSADELTLTRNGLFTFDEPVQSHYRVVVSQNPYWQRCEVSSGIGSATAAVANIRVSCSEVNAVKTAFSPGLLSPYGVAVDPNGDVYVTEFSGNVVKKISPEGVVLDTISHASLNMPYGIASDADGNIYIANFGNDSITKMSRSGVFSTIADPSFSGLAGIAVDRLGTVYVVNSGNNTISKILAGGNVSLIADPSISSPRAIAVDSLGSIYIPSLSGNSITKITSGGAVTVITDASIDTPYGIAIHQNGSIFVANYGNSTFSRIAPGTGAVTVFAPSAIFQRPFRITVGTGENVYVIDNATNDVYKIAPSQ